jgi:hypothetical protein
LEVCHYQQGYAVFDADLTQRLKRQRQRLRPNPNPNPNPIQLSDDLYFRKIVEEAGCELHDMMRRALAADATV